MTLIVDDDFIAIDEAYTKKHGYKWIAKIESKEFFKILEDYKKLPEEKKVAYEAGELDF